MELKKRGGETKILKSEGQAGLRGGGLKKGEGGGWNSFTNYAMFYDGRVDTKELEKTEHFQDLAQYLRTIWNMKVKVIPLGIDVLKATPIKLIL